MIMSSKDKIVTHHDKHSSEDFKYLPFFRLWTKKDLEDATKDHKRAVQAKWPILAIIFLLWRWALENRKLTFETLLPKHWTELKLLLNLKKNAMVNAPVTASAFAQARQKIGIKPIQKLYEMSNKKMMAEFEEMSHYKGLRLYAVDGTSINLPSRTELEKTFGRPSSGLDIKKCYPQAFLVTLELIRLGWIKDYRLDRYDMSELKLAKDMAKSLCKGDLLLGDRLFFETSWFFDLNKRNVKFLFRANSNRNKSLTKESQVVIDNLRKHSDKIDCMVDLKVNTNNKGRPKRFLRLRYIEIHRTDQNTLYFFTNLSGGNVVTDEIEELYRKRWGIETDYRVFKGPKHLPVVLSRKVKTVKQEILLRILAHNSIRYVQAEACQKNYHNEQIYQSKQPKKDLTEKAEAKGESQIKWGKKHIVANREILPIDLRMGTTVALIFGNILHFIIYPRSKLNLLYQQLLLDVLTYEIYSKLGRHYPRYGKNYNRKKSNSKGNIKAQNKRRAERKKRLDLAK